MPVSLIIVDDFIRNADQIRAQALRLNYAQSGAYPGLNSVQRIDIEGLDQEISAIVGEPLRAPVPPESHGKCRLTLAKDDQLGKIHVDPSDWSGILFLSRPEDCRGGTEFYRHIATGTDQVPTDLKGLNDIGFSSYAELKREIIEKDALDRSKWELTMTVPMRFNRLILLRPWLWHTAGPGFGDTVENGRLIYVMFFRRGGS